MNRKNAKMIKTQLAESAADEIPEILKKVEAQIPQFGKRAEKLKVALPRPDEISFVRQGSFYRLEDHNRSFCEILEKPKARKFLDAPVLIFKGLESQSQNFAAFVKSFFAKENKVAGLTAAEHFLLVENKIPGLLTFAEAELEFKTACRVHNKYWNSYGEIAEMPIPILLHKFPTETLEAVLSKFPKLSSRIQERIKMIGVNGLGAVVFFFPYAPTRILSDYEFYQKNTEKVVPDAKAVKKLIQLFARLLLVQEMPWTPFNNRIGSCFDPRNATHRGGVCDLDSIVEFSEITSADFFTTSLHTSIERLTETVCYHMGLWSDDTNYLQKSVGFYVQQCLLSELESESSKHKIPIDERIWLLLKPSSISELLKFRT